LLYLSADQICRPVNGHPGASVTESPVSKQHRLVRFVGWGLEISIRGQSRAETRRVGVPCRPTVQVLQLELASRLLMAALVECRDASQLRLRLADNRRDWRARITDPEPSRVQVTPLAPASVPGLCGRILETLQDNGEQGAKKLLRNIMGDFYGEWVIYQVEAELVALGYMSTQTTPWWRPAGNFPRVVADCEQLRTLAEASGQAVSHWREVTLANQTLSDALLADCIDSITPPTPTDDEDFAWPFRRGGASRSGRRKRVP
jgi:hypothetical protein